MSIRKLDLYIGGAWVAASSTEVLEAVNPATGEVLAHVPVATPADLDAAAASATAGFAVWRKTSPAERCTIILRAAGLLRERLETIAVVMSSEQGKPLQEARAEVLRAAELIEWAAEEGRRTYGQTVPAPDGTRYLTFWEPIGPVLALTPWNFPLVSPARKVGSSLAAGCSCILKPSEITPLSATELVRAFADAGLPAGVLNLVLGNPAPISRHLLEHDAVRAVTFTGSVPVGKSLCKQAGRLMKPALMELGGHSPVIIFDDVDVEIIAKAAVAAKFRNAGQICTSPTRFYVHANIYDAFVDTFSRHAAALRLDAKGEGAGVMGPVVSERRCQALLDLIDDARAKGARVMAGGKARAGAGFFLEPTVLADVPGSARIMSEEPFGPVAVFNRFTEVEEVLAAANGLPFGLAAYLFTADLKVARRVSHGLECGIVGVNSFSGSNPETPFGGNKDSGHGREGGTEGVREYMTLKFIVEGTL
jgi:succinate-semialdehyde dehydrogenase / glutarate-semialdehyde dehydrogenase